MPLKIMIASPAYGNTFYSPYVRSIMKLTTAMNKSGWRYSFLTLSYAEIIESRNYLLTYWFDKSDATHILFLDADMGFEPELIADMVAFNKPVVGAVYPKRSVDLHRIAELAIGGDSVGRAVGKAHGFVVWPLPKNERTEPVNGFIEVEGCGSGILLIQRSCIETMIKRIPTIVGDRKTLPTPLAKDINRVVRAFDILHVNGMRLSEDYSFCHRWRHLCNGSVWASINHEIVHLGHQEIKGRYSDNLPNVIRGQLKLERSSSAMRLRTKKKP